MLALLVALPACDEDKDTGGSASESEGTGESGGGSESGSESGGGSSETGAEAAVCDVDHVNTSRPCEGGTQFCFTHDSEEFDWNSCVAAPVCVPGTGDECEVCMLDAQGVPIIVDNCEGATSTPLVLSFDGTPVEYGSAGKHFDLGVCAATDWPTANTPWLALDRDRSGHIDGGSELFGSATRLRGGGLADNGFTALTELDADGDGKVTASDPKFAELVLWADGYGDRRSSGLELPVSGPAPRGRKM